MKIRALDTLEITIPVPKADWKRLGRRVTVLPVKAGAEADVPEETALKLVTAGLVEKV